MPKISGLIDVNEFKRRVAAKHQPADAPRANKFNATPTTTEAGRFDSKHEAGEVGKLVLLQARSIIANLRLQRPFDLVVSGVLIAGYVADAEFLVREEWELQTLDGPLLLMPGMQVVCDAKSKATRTPQYRMKKNLMKALYGIKVIEL